MITPECDIRCGYCGEHWTYECDGCGVTMTREQYDEDGRCTSCRVPSAAFTPAVLPDIHETIRQLGAALARVRGVAR